MSKDPEQQSAAPEPGAPEQAAETDHGVDGQSPEAEQPRTDEAESLRAVAEEHRERSLRLAAELENVRRRTAREAESTRRYAVERFAADLLPVVDSLELALEAAGEAPDSVREGLEMTLKLLRDTLAKHHIEAVAPGSGDAFDPAVHEAMAAQPTAEAAPDSVLTVVQKGYRLHDRVLRPARVIVARHPEAGA